MAEKESESEGETIETGWSVSTSRVLIQFYSENPLRGDYARNISEEYSVLLVSLAFQTFHSAQSNKPCLLSNSHEPSCHLDHTEMSTLSCQLKNVIKQSLYLSPGPILPVFFKYL